MYLITSIIYTLSLHDALPISPHAYLYGIPYELYERYRIRRYGFHGISHQYVARRVAHVLMGDRSEEHTSELQSRENIVCRLLLEKKKYIMYIYNYIYRSINYSCKVYCCSDFTLYCFLCI